MFYDLSTLFKNYLAHFFVLSLSLTILSTNNLPFAFARVVAHVFHIKQGIFLREAKKQIVDLNNIIEFVLCKLPNKKLLF